MLRKMFKIVGIAAAALVVLIIVGLIYFNSSFPKAEPPANTIVELTPERIARGEYLANHVSVCMDCHSTRDWSKFTGPITPGTEAKGGDVFGRDMGFPGTIYARNISPAGIGDWTDGEIIRTITTGVNKHDEALFPIMPYYNYNQMAEEDLFSIVAYLRTLKPIENKVPAPEFDFPVNFIVKTMPVETYKPRKPVNRENTIEYGKYLVTMASCADCHTPTDEEHKPIAGMEFAGGMEFIAPIGTIRTVNITPHEETGIGKWSKEDFIKKFKSFDPKQHEYINVGRTDFNTPMPWTMYAGMTEEDLGAIYDYLRTLKPKNNFVNRFSPNK